MGHFASRLKELDNPDSPIHIGSLFNFMQLICQKFSENEMDILGWLNRRQPIPPETACPECLELHLQGKSYDGEFFRQSQANKKVKE